MPRLSKIGAAALAAFGWTTGASTSVTASYLVVSGGGSGGGSPPGSAVASGGGGAGGLLTGTATLNTTLSYTVIVGAGGAVLGNGTTYAVGTNGSPSSFNSVAPVGGGTGGVYGNPNGTNGSTGGSGGGGGFSQTGSSTGGAGTSGQGYAGGNGGTIGSGGGGGAGGVGANASASGGGNGGVGVASSISGTSTYYAGGGGGEAEAAGTVATSGGNGGGGAGGYRPSNTAGQNGVPNTGGGGGGGQNLNLLIGQGGSGVVIISYAGAQRFSGGIVTSVGGNTIHTFTTSGTLGPITALSASYLIVAGGAGSGSNVGGGGGAGGLLSGSGVTIDPNSTYLVTVGAGGAAVTGETGGNSGSNSSFSMVSTAAVGGGGGSARTGGANTGGAIGGSGGGGGGGTSGSLTGFAGTSGQGYAGGNGQNASTFSGGGGGGAGGVGSNASVSSGGNGGVGATTSIITTTIANALSVGQVVSSSVYFAGGGGGGANASSTSAGSGGSGGGGAGTKTSTAPTAGTANTGGGGGGGGDGSTGEIGAAGGSGCVIISYAGSQQMAGGIVTSDGTNTIHVFKSTGYLTPIKYSTGSLRFRKSATARLNKTYGTSPTSRTTMTMSAWVKRGSLSAGTTQALFGTANNYENVTFFTDDTIRFTGPYMSGQQGIYITNAIYRDPAAWYHIVAVYDTTNAVAGDRMRLYVNGVQVTSFSSQTNSNQNNTTTEWLVSGAVSSIASTGGSGSGSLFDGEMTEINVIDGQALPPTAFGAFNSYGVWQPITYGGSYGKNGFYLPFNRQAVSYVGYFSGSQSLSVASNAVFGYGTGDFTMEGYFYLNDLNQRSLMSNLTTGSSTAPHIYYNSTSGLTYYTSGSVVMTGTPLKINQWYHIAVSRNSGTTRMFVNGFQVGTYTDSNNYGSSNPFIVGDYGSPVSGASQFYGYCSNVRVIKGTGLYSSNFIPSTSALTAVSGTSILTLQNSSIIDNSGNSLSITNNGGVSTGQTYPFAYGIFDDQSSTGNNWVPTNVSGAFGTTLDYLGDAPTLTSASVSNYCTLNPLTPVSQTITDGNLALATSTGNASSSTYFPNTGKWYWEVYINALGSGNTASLRVGVCNTTGANAQDLGGSAYGWCFLGDGRVYYNGSTSSYGVSVTAGDTMMVALDLDAGKIWYGKNGTWMASGNPATGANASQTFTANQNMSPALASGTGTPSYKINFGQQPFLYTAPSGFVQINAYNL